MNRLACLLAAVVLFVSVAAAQSKKVVVFDLSPTELADLRSVSANLALAEATTKDALEKVADADAVLGGVSPEMVKAARKLQWVQIYSAGVEGYMFRELVNSNITVTNTKIIQGPEIADHAFALLLALTRKINLAVARRASEEWRPEGFDAIELTGKRALIIGLGGIGAQIAQRAWAFGMKVEAVDPRDTPITAMVERVVPPDRLRDMLPRADVVFMSAPLTKETQKELGETEFSLMKKGAYFIAVSRGKTYDLNALVKALDEKRLAGAGVDVTDPEPLPKGHPLWKFENVVITPHIATRSDLLEDRRMTLIKENLRRFEAGLPLLNVVDKQKGY